MSLKAPFDLLGRRKNVHADDNIDTLASSETVTADSYVNPPNGKPLFDLPPSHANVVSSFSTGAPADDAPGLADPGSAWHGSAWPWLAGPVPGLPVSHGVSDPVYRPVSMSRTVKIDYFPKYDFR